MHIKCTSQNVIHIKCNSNNMILTTVRINPIGLLHTQK